MVKMSRDTGGCPARPEERTSWRRSPHPPLKSVRAACTGGGSPLARLRIGFSAGHEAHKRAPSRTRPKAPLSARNSHCVDRVRVLDHSQQSPQLGVPFAHGWKFVGKGVQASNGDEAHFSARGTHSTRRTLRRSVIGSTEVLNSQYIVAQNEVCIQADDLKETDVVPSECHEVRNKTDSGAPVAMLGQAQPVTVPLFRRSCVSSSPSRGFPSGSSRCFTSTCCVVLRGARAQRRLQV